MCGPVRAACGPDALAACGEGNPISFLKACALPLSACTAAFRAHMRRPTYPAPTTATIALTTSGSNCVPAFFSSSPTAALWDIAVR
jgi:hypothetical protein